MALFDFHFHVQGVDEKFINQKFNSIMASIKDLTAQVDDLQVALDAEQQQVADLLAANTTAISNLEQTVADLQALLADGGTAEERQALADKITAIKADLESTIPDETTPEEPTNPDVQQF
jgi:uncharacterized membrane-anchored protein YhcB (DUF1043 family)